MLLSKENVNRMTKLEKNLRKIIRDLNLVHDIDKVSSDENLFAIGALDSLILVQYVLAIEDELNVSIPNTEINFENFKSFAAQIQFLESQRQKAG
jgi:acyl carrier protein